MRYGGVCFIVPCPVVATTVPDITIGLVPLTLVSGDI